MPDEICPVCSGGGKFFYKTGKKGRSESEVKRFFFLCPSCSLVFQSILSLPRPDEELARYELHRNDKEDEGYRNWLGSFIKSSVVPWYHEGNILDFGSGPRPVLTELLESEGYPVFSYDPFFAPRWPDPDEGPFSLILLCEVLEHIHDPLKEFKRLNDLAADGAVLSLKTQFLPSVDSVDFKGWWYKEDPTHIRFYNSESLRVLGAQSGWDLVREDGKSLAVYKKSSP
ncbi:MULTISPECIES: class I SAM-dependent methyltransferase [unclassified Oceanispirochaeta]|uniref:class I SAM-dependent methyltransferase n=1 Tax=unclassified Oceanispirochaeta TaxID=2635722 RepID=UPI000E099CD4|nr:MULTISPECIES: class I SAM-dependent methyltransferase [unclassified Oceanispirochaeta]MBF9015699.1 class I SAM-dependent methyltransferase [Oceanispirochaeta sp. M2]NPD72164.1 class I SAM-dependent methyltransferase [Oceanispirochaeta sp. M1]RDG32262.1 class I SAM-dependent methyltransferase [Oceanispirochaeta sp. M1]